MIPRAGLPASPSPPPTRGLCAGGVPDRWVRMAEFINHFATPCHARSADDVTAKVKERRRELEVKKAAAAAQSTKPAAAAAPPPPPAPSAAAAPTPKKTAAAATAPGSAGGAARPAAAAGETDGGKPAPSAAVAMAATAATAASGSGGDGGGGDGGGAGAAAVWSPEQQKALETALHKFPASVGTERWDRIAEAVPGKTRGECVKRYKEIVAAVKAKKAGGAAA